MRTLQHTKDRVIVKKTFNNLARMICLHKVSKIKQKAYFRITPIPTIVTYLTASGGSNSVLGGGGEGRGVNGTEN